MDINNVFSRLRESPDNFIEYYEAGKKHKKKFSELYKDVLQLGSFLGSLQLQRGDRIGIIGKNGYEWVVVDLTLMIKGIISVPFDSNVKHDIEIILTEYDLSAVFSNLSEYTSHAKVYDFKNIYQVDPILETDHFLSYTYSEEDIFTVLFTSGTSGKPKAIEVRAKSFNNLVSRTQEMFKFNGKDKFLIFLPLHVYIERCYIFSAILIGFSVILVPLEFLILSIKKDKPTVIIGVPLFFESFHKIFLEKIRSIFLLSGWYNLYLLWAKLRLNKSFYPFKKAWGGSIRYLLTGSAPINIKTLQFFDKMGVKLYEGYGMTEMAGMITLNYPGNYKIGSVGTAFPDKYIKISERGEILVKSEFNANTKYYRATEEENASTYLPENYIATGDMGYLDSDGFLFINGRIKDLIVLSNGKKVHPNTVEEKFLTSKSIKNCLVFGDNKPYLVALVVPKFKEVSYEEIRREMGAINSLLGLDERINNFFVSYEPFSQDNNMITSSLKVNRKYIISKYSKELENLYN